MLETRWFLLWGVLWTVYFMLGGFDLGAGMLSPVIAKTDAEKQKVLGGVIGPFWDGNEVWLITAGGVTFAAFPAAYAALFSALYTPLMVLLFALIVRAVSIEFRDKREGVVWRSLCDAGIFIGSFLPSLLFGVAFANIFMGIPIDGDGVYKGNLLTLLNPYGLAGGLFFLVLFALHGAGWIAVKGTGTVAERARAAARRLWPLATLLAVIFLLLSAFATRLWNNYFASPPLLIVPLLAVVSILSMRLFMAKERWGWSFLASLATILFAVFFGVIGLYPALLPSTLNAAYGVTIYNGASGHLTLAIMLVVAIIFVPIVIIYQGWVYKLFMSSSS